jgi:hypothetical protein
MASTPGPRVRDTALAVAAVVVVVASAYTVHVKSGPTVDAMTTTATTITVGQTPGTAAEATPTGSATPNTSETATAEATATATPTASPTSSSSDSPTPSPSSSTAPASLAEARSVLARSSDVTVSVLGDGTGDSPTDWVTRWARALGVSRSVRLHRWLPDSRTWSSDVVTFGSPGQPQVSIWNCSQPYAKADFPADRIGNVQPEKPDLVLYSFGHSDSADSVTDHLSSTIAAVRTKWGTDIAGVVILQNPGRWSLRKDQDRTLSALRTWAAASEQPTIDVAKAFVDSPSPSSELMRDDTYPSASGSLLWEQTVAKALSSQ